jgi:hypothetical protein
MNYHSMHSVHEHYMHITSFISMFSKQSKRTLIVCRSTMCNYMLFGDGVPQYYHEDNCMRMSGMRTAEEALENEAAWAKIEKRLAKEKFARDGIKAAWANEATAKAAWEKAHDGMAAVYANGYLSIAQLACDEKYKQKKRKFPMLTSTSIEATDNAEFYCAQCEQYLNIAEHYDEHMTGEFHKNRVPNLPIPNIDAMDLMHVMDLGIGSMLSSSSSSK